MIEFDIFISHASEDKEMVARPLADRLAAAGLMVWFDEAELLVGDPLRSKIDAGLNQSRFGVVILSPSFFSKAWPKAELDGLIARESHGDKVILPVWHNVTASEVRSFSPILAGRLGVSTQNGLSEVTKKILQAVRTTGRSRVTGRPIYAGKLTKKVLLRLPIGTILITNTVNPDLTPRFVEELGAVEPRESLWNSLRIAGLTGNKCYAFADMANLRANLAARQIYRTEEDTADESTFKSLTIPPDPSAVRASGGAPRNAIASPQYDAFISYVSSDRAFAEEANRRLTQAGFQVWFDKARLNPGCDWHREIEVGYESSRVVLPVLTPRWKLSEWTRFETYRTEAVIPLMVEGAFTDIFTPPLTRYQGQAIDLVAGGDAGWQQLFAALRLLLALPAPDKLARLADVRYQANPYFVGRERDLNQIHEELHRNPTAILTQGRARAVTALGGVGKTTLVRQYVEKFWRCYEQIFWIDCRQGIETEFARLCDLLLPAQEGSTNVTEKAQLALGVLEEPR